MSHKRLGIDIDGCLADFTSAFTDLIVQVSGRDLFPPRPFDPPCWHYPEHYGYTHAELTAVWQSIKSSPSFWYCLPRMQDGKAALGTLMKWSNNGDHDVYFLTTRKGATAKHQTEEWFGKHYSLCDSVPTILITDNKSYIAAALHLDILIDDYHQNTQQVALSVPACRTYLLNRSWNKNEYAGIDVVRVDTLEEMFQRERL